MVRSSPVFLARPVWYDRNPSTVNYVFSQESVAPHSLATRTTVTVAAGKKMWLMAFTCDVKRQTAATTAARVRAYWSFSTTPIVEVLFYGNNVDSGECKSVYPGVLLLAGQTFGLYTEDVSTGGTCAYFASYLGVTFDA